MTFFSLLNSQRQEFKFVDHKGKFKYQTFNKRKIPQSLSSVLSNLQQKLVYRSETQSLICTVKEPVLVVLNTHLAFLFTMKS